MPANTITINHTIDAIVVIAYLILSFIFGVFASRILGSRGKRDNGAREDNYFLAGRRMPGWLNGISYAVTCMNADVAPAYCGMAVVVGLSVCWFYMSRFGLGLLLAGMLFAIRWRQLGIATGPEFFALRFGGRGGKFVRVWSSLIGVFLGMVPWIGAGMLGVHMIFGPIFGIESKAVTLAIVLPVLLCYVWISGFAGVLITDLMQTGIIIIANIVLIVMVLARFGGPDGLVEAVSATHGAEQAGDILSVLPVAGHRVFGPLMVLAWLIVPTIGIGGNVLTEGQRILSCRSPKEAGKVSVWSEVMLFVMLLLLTLPAIGALIDHPELYHAGPTEREKAYGLMLADYLPVGLLGLALAALSASVMSTIDSHLNYGAQTLVNDVYRPIVGKISDKNAVRLGRAFMLIILTSAIVVVYHAKSLIGIAVVLTGIFGSGAALGWGQWWWWRLNIWSWVSANVGGPIVYFVMGFILKRFGWWQDHLAMGESMVQQLGMLQAIVSMLATTTIWIVVTLLTKPEDMEVLKKFYRKAKPMGLWRPVRDAVEMEDGLQARPREPRYLIPAGLFTAILGTSWIILAVLCISELLVGRYGIAIAMALASIILALCFKRMFNWHIERMI